MNSSFAFFMVLFLSLMSSSIMGADELSMEVEVMQFCRDVQDREPVGADTLFLNNVEQVYCFTRITTVNDTQAVSHVWYYNDEEMARVNLTVMGETWRTWSSKRILEEWTGEWRVDVVAANGTILASKKFRIESVTE